MRKNNEGFTLIEILIALAILSIALTAIIHTTTQNIKDHHYLYQKTVATWVGTEVINEARVSVLKIREGESIKKQTWMLEQHWPWLLELTTTPNAHIKKISVTVFSPVTQGDLVHLESYLYAQP